MSGTKTHTYQRTFADYDGFVEKFKPKKTTDDCYTPAEVYEEVLKYVGEHYDLEGKKILRPFYPGGDYEREDYTDAIVIDNPPFSKLAEITKFFAEREIPFFIFTPTMTGLCRITMKGLIVTDIITGCDITYENGAKINTSFRTNMFFRGCRAIVEPEFSKRIEAAQREARQEKKNPNQIAKIIYPDNVVTSAMLSTLKRRVEIPRAESVAGIGNIGGRKIFGGALLVSDRLAKEIKEIKEIKEVQEVRIELTAEERALVERLSN